MDSLPETKPENFLGRWFSRRFTPLQYFRSQIRNMRWLVPAGLMLLVIAYEAGPASWIYNNFGFSRHLLLEILIFGTVGPVLAFAFFDFLLRWLDERDTSDLQAQLLIEAREDARKSRHLSDDAYQMLYAMRTLLGVLKMELPPETGDQIEETEKSLNEAMTRLQSHLEEKALQRT